MKSHSESRNQYNQWLKNSISLFKTPIPKTKTGDEKDYQFASAKNKLIFEKLTSIQDAKFGFSKTSKMDDIVKIVLNDLLSMESFPAGSAELSLRIKTCLAEVIQIKQKLKKDEFKTKLKPTWFYELLQKPNAEKKLTEVVEKLEKKVTFCY